MSECDAGEWDNFYSCFTHLQIAYTHTVFRIQPSGIDFYSMSTRLKFIRIFNDGDGSNGSDGGGIDTRCESNKINEISTCTRPYQPTHGLRSKVSVETYKQKRRGKKTYYKFSTRLLLCLWHQINVSSSLHRMWMGACVCALVRSDTTMGASQLFVLVDLSLFSAGDWLHST